MDEFNRVVVNLIRQGGKDHLLFDKDGGLNKTLPSAIIKDLGEPADRIVGANKDKIARREKKISELQEYWKTATEYWSGKRKHRPQYQ